MKGKIFLAVGFLIGIGIAYWLREVASPYAWVLFYH